MSIFETFTVEKWIYSTLSSDDTLAGLLADVSGSAKGFQISVYNSVAPVKDARSKKTPVLPYIVFDRAGTSKEYEKVLCGWNVVAFPQYRVTLWYSQSGSVSSGKVQSAVNRMVSLLDNQSFTLDGLSIYCSREDTEQPIEVQTDGRIDYGFTAVFSFNIIL